MPSETPRPSLDNRQPLILSRKRDESIVIEDIQIIVVAIKDDAVRLGIHPHGSSEVRVEVDGRQLTAIPTPSS